MTGAAMARDSIQITTTPIKACLATRIEEDFLEWTMAMYRSTDMADRVKKLTNMDTVKK